MISIKEGITGPGKKRLVLRKQIKELCVFWVEVSENWVPTFFSQHGTSRNG